MRAQQQRTLAAAEIGVPPPRPHGATASRRLLLVSFYFPPGNTSSGGLRALKLAKYLPEFGWQASVLTVQEGRHDSSDPELLREIPAATPLHRAYCFDIKALSLRGRYPGFLAIPDRYIAWLFPAVATALGAIRRERIDAILSTSPVATAHLVALLAKRLTGLPWIADFRDPWAETEGCESRGGLRQSIDLALERRVVRDADRVTVTTREFATYLHQRYPEIPRQRIVAVYNGYDEADFAHLDDTGAGAGAAPFTIVHAGLVNPAYRAPGPVLEALRRGRGARLLPADLRLLWLGGGPYTVSDSFRGAVAQAGLQDVVQVGGRTPYREALACVASASALLLMQGGDDTRMLIPAKAFEYLRTGRLVLAVCPSDSATARLVREFPGGFVASPDDPTDIAAKLVEVHRLWRRGGGNVDRRAVGLDRYDRRATARDVAAVLDALTARRGREGT